MLIALTLAFGTIPYFLAGDMAVSESRAALEMRRFQAEPQTTGVEKQDRIAGEPASGRGDPDTTDSPAVAMGGAGAQPEQPPRSASQRRRRPPQAQRPAELASNRPALRDSLQSSDEAFAAAVIRITAVVLLIALVYVFGSLYRYSMRLASYYDEKADSLRLLEAGDRQLEERLSQITIPGQGRAGDSGAKRGERV